MGLFEVFGQILKKVSDKNEADPAVETAEPVVFDRVRKRVREVQEAETPSRGRGDIYKDYAEKVRQAQRENELDPEVKTADSSVFDDLLREIEEHKNDAARPEASRTHSEPVFIPRVESQPRPQYGSHAMTVSGGSIQLRSQPEMGAAKLDLYVPDRSQIRVIGMSENSIILDGKKSRFVEVEYNGRRGWLLENYLMMA